MKVFIVYYFTSDEHAQVFKVVDTQDKAIFHARECRGYWEEVGVE